MALYKFTYLLTLLHTYVNIQQLRLCEALKLDNS